MAEGAGRHVQCDGVRPGLDLDRAVAAGGLHEFADWPATRPKVERKIGQLKVAADFALLAAAVNLARLAVLGITSDGRRWAAAST